MYSYLDGYAAAHALALAAPRRPHQPRHAHHRDEDLFYPPAAERFRVRVAGDQLEIARGAGPSSPSR